MKKVKRKVPTKGEAPAKDENNVDVKTRQENRSAAVSFKVARFATHKHKNVGDMKAGCQALLRIAAGSIADNGISTESKRLIQSVSDKINAKLSKALQLPVLDYNALPDLPDKIDPCLEQAKANARYMLRCHKAMMLIDQRTQKLIRNLEKNS